MAKFEVVMPTNPKLLSLIGAICTRVKEKEGYLTKTKLIKYLYLIDIEYYKKFGTTFTGYNWIFYEFGPWAYEYNDTFQQMEKDPNFRLDKGDAVLISCRERESLESVLYNDDLLMRAMRIIDRWAVESLGELLNYVYFHTDPMENAERNKPLDFEKVKSAEPIPKFSLTPGSKSQKDKAEILKRIQDRIATRPKSMPKFTPPKFDEKYFEAVQVLDKEDQG
jgi:hypothetical protein